MYRKAAFTVYPSLVEGFGLPIMESLLDGLPVLVPFRWCHGRACGGRRLHDS